MFIDYENRTVIEIKGEERPRKKDREIERAF
jgi:hypothetical protein